MGIMFFYLLKKGASEGVEVESLRYDSLSTYNADEA